MLPLAKAYIYTSVIISDELPKAFFYFSLRRLGAELGRGVSTIPPPQSRWSEFIGLSERELIREPAAVARWERRQSEDLKAFLWKKGKNILKVTGQFKIGSNV